MTADKKHQDDIGSLFGGITFFARSHPGEMCGSNGLPLTPNSITIYGRAQFLKTIKHPHLCTYVDIIRGKHERTMVVCQYHPKPLSGQFLPLNALQKFTMQIVDALNHLNTLRIVHRSLCPENILVDDKGDVKLFNYGLYYMTGEGTDVSFPIGHPKYMAPEVLLGAQSGPKVDVWSLGMILLEQAMGKTLWAGLRLAQWLRKVLSLLHCPSVVEKIAREHNCWEQLQQTVPADFLDLLSKCLNIYTSQRPMPRQLMCHPYLKDIEQKSVTESVPQSRRHPLLERPLKELYHLWRLAGGDVQAELRKQGLIRTKPPILSLPSLVILEGTVFGQIRDRTSMLDLRVVPLPLDTLVQRLAHVPPTSYYPLIEVKSDIIGEDPQPDAANLPLVIRERDTEYQLHRILLCDRLLEGYPYKKAALIKEARKDIPPLFRGDMWAAVLEVVGDIQGRYTAIDKETPTHTDRQIEVDIPRCHQYDELLSSTEGHKKFKRILKAWVVSHPQYVYWQGLDSLCAPFLYLNFNNEAQAYACLSAFIPKYLHNFFLKDNSAVIQEYLAKFSHLIAFHDPELANHLASISFIPELFAIPWFLTMFSHVFPLHKILHLWDKLLLGDASFPLFVGLAILKQLRDTLLTSGFNECILLFSDLPEIDMERCVNDSIEMYCNTPRSVTYRQHELPVKTETNVNPDLEMSPIPLSELQKEFCPRISAANLLELMDIKQNKFSKSKVVVVDVRPPDEYNRGAIPSSINIPFSTVNLSENQLPPGPENSILHSHKGKVITVVGSRGPNASQFGHMLVQCGFPRVCVLHGGVQVLRSSNILLVPGAM
ncbi:TBC domain-containing protein kinase-like protein isoform X1 [Schistocerca americana]|uniref:TBC domain-containing protein kinase-like protein isoform X1 n=1 Tax=Schistocerca americana TaxID=7009 RepID=UPI001F4FAB80|nr:TBC domain-containing protein kinase-like protein isoform X1 [Schistocerca americana]